MYHHVTLEFGVYEEFRLCLQLIQAGSFEIIGIDEHTFMVECKIDEVLISLAEKYGDALIVSHEPGVLRRIAAALGE